MPTLIIKRNDNRTIYCQPNILFMERNYDVVLLPVEVGHKIFPYVAGLTHGRIRSLTMRHLKYK